jgi:hypothetical protein
MSKGVEQQIERERKRLSQTTNDYHKKIITHDEYLTLVRYYEKRINQLNSFNN